MTHYLSDEPHDPMDTVEYAVDATETILQLEVLFDAIAFNNSIFAIEDETNVREVAL